MPLLAFFGHHKCGTTWISMVLEEVCKKAGIRFSIINFDKNLAGTIKKNKVEFVSNTTAFYDIVSELDDYKAFHVIRDPRDILVSAYFSHRYSHPPSEEWPELLKYREELSKTSKDKGLFLEMKFNEFVFFSLTQWNYNDPSILELKMEDLIDSPYTVFLTILKYLEIIQGPRVPDDCRYNITENELSEILSELSFQKLSGGRKRGEEKIDNHFRKGIAGDWKNHFKQEHVIDFKEKYGDLLIKLGYEENNNWDIS